MPQYTINADNYEADLVAAVEELLQNEADTTKQGKLARLLAYLKVLFR